MTQPIEAILHKIQYYESDTDTDQQLLTQLIKTLLRSRRICRSSRDQSLFGIYQQIYNDLHDYLKQELKEAPSKYRFDQLEDVREWSNQLLNQAYQTILDDEHLKQLALAAQQQEPGTKLRRYALNELVEAIQLSGKLCHPQRQFATQSPQFYELLCQEAVNRTLAYVYQKIDTYDPHRGQGKRFLNWVNFRLEKMMIECRREFHQPMVVPSLDNWEQITKFNQNSNVINIASPSAWSIVEPAVWEIVKQLIEEDREGIFCKEHIRHRPEASFQAIFLARFDQKSWKQISEHWDIPISTLSSFFERCCHQFRPFFKRNLLSDTVSNY